MKILFVNKFFYRKGGAECLFFDTAAYLIKKGHNVSFFSMAHPRNLPSPYEKYFVSNIDYDSVKFTDIPKASLRLLYSFEAKRRIERLIEKEKPDIVHVNNIYHQISPSILHSIKKYKLPVVMTLHDLKMSCPSYVMLNNQKTCEACRGGRYYNCFLKGCVKKSKIKSLLSTLEMYLHHRIMHIYDLVDIFISSSLFVRDKLKQMGLDREMLYLPNFVKIDEFIPEYRWSEKAIVYFGRLSEEKGITVLMDAVKDIRGITLKIIGEGPLESHIKNKIRAEGIKNVTLLGYKTREELKNEIKKSMFVILPSTWYDNSPRSIIEGFALGKTVIASRIGGIPELVKDNKTGLLFEPGNIGELREKIDYLIANSDRIIELGKNAREFAEKELNTKKHHDKLMEIYDTAIKNKS